MPTELIFREDAYATTALATVMARSEKGIELDRTLFYPLGGGQPGDAGALVRPNGERLSVVDTRKGEAPGVCCTCSRRAALCPSSARR